jgi:hypothetical protein
MCDFVVLKPREGITMATKQRQSNLMTVRSTAPVVSKSKFEELKIRTANAAKRLKAASAEDTDAMVGVGSALALALYEKGGRQLPTVMGVDPALLWGGAAWALSRGRKTKGAEMARSAGLALVTIGVNRSAMRGSMKVAGDDDYSDDSDSDDI